MMSFSRREIADHPVLKALSSLKIMVVGLSLLFILVFWGTVAQIDSGLYYSQERYFHSFFFLIFGFIPFPGAQLILWVLFVNLTCVAISRFVYRWSHIGILIIHFGLLTYFISAYVTLHCVEESQLTLREGEASNVSSSIRDWELSVWQEGGDKKHVVAYDADNLRERQSLDFSEFGFMAQVDFYYPNAEAYTVSESPGSSQLNISGIQSLRPTELNQESEKNVPGIIVSLQASGSEATRLLLYGAETRATPLNIGEGIYHFILRHKRYPLPLKVRLEDFVMEKHPNTEIARSYKSQVLVESSGLSRDVVISMNKPLRYKNFTFYQASYSMDKEGRESSTLAVVKNSGRLLPYIASLTTFVGLVTHFLMMAFSSRNKYRVRT